MSTEIPAYGLRAYALLFSRHGSREPFSQKDLDWMVKESMRKKIFAVLLNSGWIRKLGRKLYQCIAPETAIKNLLEWRVPQMIKEAKEIKETKEIKPAAKPDKYYFHLGFNRGDDYCLYWHF